MMNTKANNRTLIDTASTSHSDSNSYFLLALLTVLNCLNFVDRQLIASFANYIVPDLGLSNTQYGLLTGLVFLIFYSVMGLFMGYLADTMNRTRLIAGALAFWSLLTALSGMAKGFISLAIPRALIGVGESALTPAALSLLMDRFPASKLSFVSSIYYLGVPIGGGISFLIASHLGPLIGWRACFYGLGTIGILMSVIMFSFKNIPHRYPVITDPSSDQKNTLRKSLGLITTQLRVSPPLRYALLGSMFANLMFGALNFDQLWLVQERGFERAEIAGITGWIFVAAGMAGALLGAYGVDYCKARYKLPRVHFIFMLTLMLSPLLLVYRLSDPGSVWFWVGFSSAFFYLGFYVGPFFSVVQELTPANVRATMIAFSLLTSNIMGLGFGNLFCGALIDWLAARNVAEPYTVALVTMTILANISLIFFYLAGRSTPPKQSGNTE